MKSQMTLPKEFSQASPVITKIEQAGYEAYFVGGSVRDVFLNQPIHDVDIATSAFPAEIKMLFKRTIDVGIEHGTVLVLTEADQYEITTFRTESTYQDFRRPEKVEFVRSLEEDLKRRDFTINALALKLDGQVIDLFDGLQDLHDRVIRAVGDPHERFHEDALRMMRGLRFISQLDFEMEAQTLLAISENSHLLKKISVERIAVEFEKLMLGLNRKRALTLFIETNAYQFCPKFASYKPQLTALADLPQLPLEDAIEIWSLVTLMLEVPIDQISSFLKAWKASNQVIKMVQSVRQGLAIRQIRQFSEYELYTLGETSACYTEQLLAFFDLPQDTSVARRYQDLPIHSLKELAINGSDLMRHFHKEAGPWLKEWLSLAERAVVEGKVLNEKQELFDYLFTQVNE